MAEIYNPKSRAIAISLKADRKLATPFETRTGSREAHPSEAVAVVGEPRGRSRPGRLWDAAVDARATDHEVLEWALMGPPCRSRALRQEPEPVGAISACEQVHG